MPVTTVFVVNLDNSHEVLKLDSSAIGKRAEKYGSGGEVPLVYFRFGSEVARFMATPSQLKKIVNAKRSDKLHISSNQIARYERLSDPYGK